MLALRRMSLWRMSLWRMSFIGVRVGDAALGEESAEGMAETMKVHGSTPFVLLGHSGRLDVAVEGA